MRQNNSKVKRNRKQFDPGGRVNIKATDNMKDKMESPHMKIEELQMEMTKLNDKVTLIRAFEQRINIHLHKVYCIENNIEYVEDKIANPLDCNCPDLLKTIKYEKINALWIKVRRYFGRP